MEKSAFSFVSRFSDIEMILLRIGMVRSDMEVRTKMIRFRIESPGKVPFLLLSQIYLEDVIQGITHLIDTKKQTGLFTYNLVGPEASAEAPVKEILDKMFRKNKAKIKGYTRFVNGKKYGALS